MQPTENIQNSCYGRTFPAHSVATKEKISDKSSKNLRKSKTKQFQSLNLTKWGGRQRWERAGSVLGKGFSIAWRTLDAQYWGVPQRRRRIHLIVDFRGGRAEEVLFERNGLSRRFAESRKKWNGITPDTTYSVDGTGEYIGGRTNRNGIDTAPPPTVISLNNHPSDSRITVEENGKCQTLTSRMGTGGGNTPLLLVGIDPYNHCLTGDKAATLGVNCGLATGRNGVILVMNDQGGNRMKVEDKDISPTLRAETHGHPPIVALNLLQDPISSENKTPCITTGNTKAGQANLAVCYSIDRAAFNQGENALYKIGIDDSGIAHTLVAKGAGAVCYPVGINGEKSGTLDASYYKGCGQRNGVEREIIAVPEQRKWIVRRLTPTECARLQGMPDWWCKDVKHSDSAEYKLWGNGMALPTLMYVTEGIALALRKEKFRKILQGKDK